MPTTEQTNTRPFKGVWIPSELWLDKTLTPTEKFLLADILSFDSGKGCYCSNETLSEQLGTTPECIRVMISKLLKRNRLVLLPTQPNDGSKRRLRTVMVITDSVTVITDSVMVITDTDTYGHGVKNVKDNGLGEKSDSTRIHREYNESTVPPNPLSGGTSKKKKIQSYEASDRAKMFGCKWWKTHPEPKGVDRIKAKIRELRELDGLFDSGVSEDQISRAWSILSADSFRKSWVANFSQMALNWQKIEMQCNGHLKPSVPVCRSWAKEKTPKEMWDDWDEYVKACTAAGDKIRFTAPTVPRP